MADTDTKPEAVAARPAAAASAKEDGATLARRWLDENLAGGIVAQNVEMWNAVHAALPALAAMFDAR